MIQSVMAPQDILRVLVLLVFLRHRSQKETRTERLEGPDPGHGLAKNPAVDSMKSSFRGEEPVSTRPLHGKTGGAWRSGSARRDTVGFAGEEFDGTRASQHCTEVHRSRPIHLSNQCHSSGSPGRKRREIRKRPYDCSWSESGSSPGGTERIFRRFRLQRFGPHNGAHLFTRWSGRSGLSR